MASHSDPRVLSFKAGADLSAKQHRFVKFGSTDELVVSASGAAEVVMGILGNAPASGEIAEVYLPGGGAKLKLAGTVARGAYIATNATGEGVAAVAGEKYGAMAMESGVSGDVIGVEVILGELET